jgi:23S rRNA (cytosine1962-C5)-methyltransferase
MPAQPNRAPPRGRTIPDLCNPQRQRSATRWRPEHVTCGETCSSSNSTRGCVLRFSRSRRVGDDAGMEAGYELLDAGNGRRLERFGSVVVERPAPSATEPQRDRAAWSSATLSFSRGGGWVGDAPTDWTVALDGLTFELRATESGQLGVFPEQLPNWNWLRQVVTRSRAAAAAPGGGFLNLFAYTGGATLAIASAGATVAHVDGSRPAVAWARRNAALSGLGDRSVRWLVDDAEGFVLREARRGRRYRGIVLDPPSYGHGAGRGVWRLDERLGGLLAACVRLTDDAPDAVLVSAHTPGYDARRLRDELGEALRRPGREVESGELFLDARSGARLPLGAFARWPAARVRHA